MDIKELMCRALCRADGGKPDAETTRQHMPYKKLWECYRPQINDIHAALDAAGFAIVPREPTDKMLEAWCKLAVRRIQKALDSGKPKGSWEGARESYKAMVATSEEKGK